VNVSEENIAACLRMNAPSDRAQAATMATSRSTSGRGRSAAIDQGAVANSPRAAVNSRSTEAGDTRPPAK